MAAFVQARLCAGAALALEQFLGRCDALRTLNDTIVPSKLDFVAQKKGAWPSRPCGDLSTRSQHTHRN